MVWILEESDDCGVTWEQVCPDELRYQYRHVAVREALEIIQDAWCPPSRAFAQLCLALEDESVAYYWSRAMRVVDVSWQPYDDSLTRIRAASRLLAFGVLSRTPICQVEILRLLGFL
jgi:hypothetical protein